MKLSCIILCTSDSVQLTQAVQSVKWCDECLIVEDSKQNSAHVLSLGKQSNIRILHHILNQDFAALRNWALGQTKGDWILFLDADESISKDLQQEILTVIQSQEYSAYYFKRYDMFLGKELHWGEVGNLHIVRLAKKGTGVWKRNVHETWDVQGKVGYLQHALIHNQKTSISEFLQKLNSYADLEVLCRPSVSKTQIFIQMCFYPLGKFLQNTVQRLGILDGIPGIMHAYCMSLYSLILRVKLLERANATHTQ